VNKKNYYTVLHSTMHTYLTLLVSAH